MSEEEREDKILLIAGVHAGDVEQKVYYWKWGGYEWNAPDIGDYAVVQCRNDFTIVKVVGLIKTMNKYAEKFTDGNNLKSALKRIHRFEIID